MESDWFTCFLPLLPLSARVFCSGWAESLASIARFQQDDEYCKRNFFHFSILSQPSVLNRYAFSPIQIVDYINWAVNLTRANEEGVATWEEEYVYINTAHYVSNPRFYHSISSPFASHSRAHALTITHAIEQQISCKRLAQKCRENLF